MSHPAAEASRPSSSSLWLGLQAQEPPAWQRFVDLYGPILYRWCRGWGLAASEAPDVVQEVLLAVVRFLPTFRRDRPGDSFTAWLRTVARNKFRDHLRARQASVQAAGGTAAQQLLAAAGEPAEPSAEDCRRDEETLSRRVCELIRGQFEERTFRAFWRLAVDGCPGQQVAEELGLTPAAVYQARYRVLRRVREEFGDLLG